MIANCLQCGEEFVTYPVRIKQGRGQFCSKKCATAYRWENGILSVEKMTWIDPNGTPKRSPEKVQAQSRIAIEIRAGRLVRQPCEICGSENAEAHHEDYSKPREVRWLCTSHYRQRHIEINKERRE